MRVEFKVPGSRFKVQSAEELSAALAAEFGTRDVYELAARLGVAIEYGRWPLVTVGEWDARAAKITVNEAALDVAPDAKQAKAAIIAHELGHVAAHKYGLDSADKEKLAEEFAAYLLGDTQLSVNLRNIWRKAHGEAISRH